MIKLIASDLDGTLLLPGGVLPEETIPLIERLYEKNILFCVASGRQMKSLENLFYPVKDKVVFLAENGALAAFHGERIYTDVMECGELSDIISSVREVGAIPLVCGADCAYAEDTDEDFLLECKKYYPSFRLVDGLENVKVKDVCKVALFDKRGSTCSGPALAEKLKDLRVIVSGKVWSDVSKADTNKGKAIRAIQRYFSISPDECMAFGDYMNDYEMLTECTHSFVPENGFPTLIKKIGHTIPSNEEKGVIRKIEELLGE